MPKASYNTTIHRALIDELRECHPEVQTRGFWNAMRQLPDAVYVPTLLAGDPDYLKQRKFIPDAWAIDEAGRTVSIFEVVASNDIPARKIKNIINFAWALDEDEYTLALVRCDLSGRRVYDCLGMGIIAAYERPVGKDELVYDLWQHFTDEVTAARLHPTQDAGRAA